METATTTTPRDRFDPRQAPKAPRTHPARESGSTSKRILLGVLTALVSVSLLTAGPLLALWAGSRIQTEAGLSMTAVGVAVGVLSVTTFLLYKALTRLSTAYDHAVGRTRPRRQLAWQEPVGVHRRAIAAQEPPSAIDWVIVVTAASAVVAFGIWFFFLA